MIALEIKEEYERLRALFGETDEKQLQLLEGTFWECARLRIELDELGKIVKKTGLIKVHPTDPSKQKELPVSKMIVKVRANYLNYISKLSNILGTNIDEDDLDLEDYE